MSGDMIDETAGDPHTGWDADTDFVAPLGGYPAMDALWNTRWTERRTGSQDRRQTDRREGRNRRTGPA